MKGDLFSVGSGSTFAYGVLDNEYSYDMTVKDALELGKRSIFHAAHRDAYSGGTINLYHVKREGWEFIGNFDVAALYFVSLTSFTYSLTCTGVQISATDK